MKMLICLKVIYGYPLTALRGFINHHDRITWKKFLDNTEFECMICPEDGKIILLLKNLRDEQVMKNRLISLPLIIEGFFELESIRLGKCYDLEKLLGFKFISRGAYPFD